MAGSRRFFLAAGAICLALLQACGGGPAVSPAAPSAKAPPASSPSPIAASQPASAAAASQAAATKSGVPKLIVPYGAIAGSFIPLWMAKAIGAFDKYGVAVEMPYIETSIAVPAMVGKQIDVLESSAAPIITVDINGNEDQVFIASALNHPILGIYAKETIKTAADLKGKVIASDKPGTPLDYAARLSLSLMGLKPTDVQLRPIGSASEVVAAMLSNQVDAGVVAPPQSFQAEVKGFHLLQNIFSRPYQNVGLVAKKSRLDELAPALRALVAAYRDGIVAYNKQPDLAMKVFDEYAKVSDPEVLRKTYDFYRTVAPFEESMQPTMQGLQAMIDFLADSTVPGAKGHKPEEFVDLRFLTDLPKAA
ncbi:MAG TPA: ABC transporter substrate-binding protein [Chloroflexota bacterium]|nr:ABC transporter substrate-binding protein [Chloroflexota bacterium]